MSPYSLEGVSAPWPVALPAFQLQSCTWSVHIASSYNTPVSTGPRAFVLYESRGLESVLMVLISYFVQEDATVKAKGHSHRCIASVRLLNIVILPKPPAGYFQTADEV